jgi:putative ABC transport system permease protein
VLERVAGPVVAWMLGLRFAILRQQLSSGLWRAAGTCAALMVGLAILVAMETQGNTLIRGWRIPDKFPDVFIVSWGSALNDEQIQKIQQVKGIVPGDLMPIAIASPEFGGTGVFAFGAALAMPDATMFFGIDPDQGMRMMELDFRQGNPTDAARMLKLGRHIIVTEEFHQLKGLGLGDKLPLKTRTHGIVDYTIAGVVWSPGIDVIVSMFDMSRQFDQRTAASIFGSMDDAKNDFGVDNIRLFAANLEYFTDKDKVLEDVQKQLGVAGMAAGDVRQIKHGIETAFGDLLLLVSVVPFAAMAVASLGVTNTIMASIRTRRWQFGVLRSIGFTRSQLLRLVLTEALLVGVVGCGLGLAAGFVMAVDARELSRIVTGYYPPMAVPWGIVSIGTAAVMVISLIASLGPAVGVARTEPLSLLQAGRAAA